jgi:hypothetical protein
MAFLHHIVHALVPVLVDGLASLLSRRPPKISREGGRLVLRYPLGFRIFSLALFPVLSFLFCLGAVGVVRNPDALRRWETFVGAGFVILPAALGGYLVVESFRVRIAITSEGISSDSPWQGNRTLRWDEIGSVSYSCVPNWFVITSDSGARVRAHIFLNGLPWLAQALISNVPGGVYARADRELRSWARLASPDGDEPAARRVDPPGGFRGGV